MAVEYRWAEGQYQRLPELAADLVKHQVTVIATPGSSVATIAAKAATTTIPTVFLIATNPVEVGFVTSLNKPGGNLTGVTSLNVEVAAKQLELLHELVPRAAIVGLLVNPAGPLAEPATRTVQAAARVGDGGRSEAVDRRRTHLAQGQALFFRGRAHHTEANSTATTDLHRLILQTFY